MLAAEMNALFEKNMELWNKLFGMMSKQPDMSMTYADYLMEQLEDALEHITAASGKIQEALDRLQDVPPYWEDM